MRVYCKDCLQDRPYITNVRTRHYCLSKDKWIPKRHYEEGRKKCGDFILVTENRKIE